MLELNMSVLSPGVIFFFFVYTIINKLNQQLCKTIVLKNLIFRVRYIEPIIVVPFILLYTARHSSG